MRESHALTDLAVRLASESYDTAARSRRLAERATRLRAPELAPLVDAMDARADRLDMDAAVERAMAELLGVKVRSTSDAA